MQSAHSCISRRIRNKSGSIAMSLELLDYSLCFGSSLPNGPMESLLVDSCKDYVMSRQRRDTEEPTHRAFLDIFFRELAANEKLLNLVSNAQPDAAELIGSLIADFENSAPKVETSVCWITWCSISRLTRVAGATSRSPRFAGMMWTMRSKLFIASAVFEHESRRVYLWTRLSDEQDADAIVIGERHRSLSLYNQLQLPQLTVEVETECELEIRVKHVELYDESEVGVGQARGRAR